MSSKAVRVTLTWPQADAILSAIAEVTAGDTGHWPAPSMRALLAARDKIEAASGPPDSQMPRTAATR